MVLNVQFSRYFFLITVLSSFCGSRFMIPACSFSDESLWSAGNIVSEMEIQQTLQTVSLFKSTGEGNLTNKVFTLESFEEVMRVFWFVFEGKTSVSPERRIEVNEQLKDFFSALAVKPNRWILVDFLFASQKLMASVVNLNEQFIKNNTNEAVHYFFKQALSHATKKITNAASASRVKASADAEALTAAALDRTVHTFAAKEQLTELESFEAIINILQATSLEAAGFEYFQKALSGLNLILINTSNRSRLQRFIKFLAHEDNLDCLKVFLKQNLVNMGSLSALLVTKKVISTDDTVLTSAIETLQGIIRGIEVEFGLEPSVSNVSATSQAAAAASTASWFPSLPSFGWGAASSTALVKTSPKSSVAASGSPATSAQASAGWLPSFGWGASAAGATTEAVVEDEAAIMAKITRFIANLNFTEFASDQGLIKALSLLSGKTKNQTDREIIQNFLAALVGSFEKRQMLERDLQTDFESKNTKKATLLGTIVDAVWPASSDLPDDDHPARQIRHLIAAYRAAPVPAGWLPSFGFGGK